MSEHENEATGDSGTAEPNTDAAATDAAPHDQEAASAPADEPSHEATGIGVIGGALVDPDHHGQDGGRDTVWAGDAQRAMSGEQEQRLPSMSQNNADQVEKVAGIVAQTRADMGTANRDEVRRVLGQRLDQAGIALSGTEVDDLTAQITTGD